MLICFSLESQIRFDPDMSFDCLSIWDADDCSAISHFYVLNYFENPLPGFPIIKFLLSIVSFENSYVTLAVMKFYCTYGVHRGMNIIV